MRSSRKNKSNNNKFSLGNVAAQKTSGRIPVGADNYKKEGEPIFRNFTIGYEFYNQSLCEISSLNHSPLRKILENSKKFGKCSSVRELSTQGIDMKRVTNSNNYRKFFQDLEPDVELKEFDAGQTERALFFVDPYRRILQMVAYTNGHVEDKKQKR